MDKRLLFSAAVLILRLILSAPSLAQKPPEAKPPAPAAACTPSSDDVPVYLAALRKIVLKGPEDKSPVVLLSQTSTAYPPGMAVFTASPADDRKELLDATSTTTRSAFDAKAGLRCDLRANAQLGARVAFLTPQERDDVFAKNADVWKDFAGKYPNAAGFTIVSAIGFNAAHNQALVYVGNSCGMLCGTGYIVLLKKKKDDWIAAKTAKIWAASASPN